MAHPSPDGQVLPERRAHAAPSLVIGSRRCPVCQVAPLQGAQTACSAACRRERSRRRLVERQQHRDRELAALLDHAAALEARAAALRAEVRRRLTT